MHSFRLDNRFGVVVLGLTATLCGCVRFAPQAGQFVTPFLPPAPAANTIPAVETVSMEPPKLEWNLYRNETPRFLSQEFPPRPTQADVRIRRAEERFDAGKKLYQSGDMEGARREFDRALDMVLSSVGEPTDRTGYDRRLESLVESIYRYDVEGLGSGEVAQEPRFDKTPLDDILSNTFPVDPRLKHKVTAQLAATVSQLPLEVTDPVLSFINFFSSERGRKVLIAGYKRQGKYKKLISRILDEEGVPQELIFLAQAESGFLPRAVSYMSASGMWQFIRQRGNEYGLTQTAYADERFDPEKATRAAARHLRDLYNEFGDWYLAIAAYNCGPVTVERAIQRTGYADVWELRERRTLPLETSNYVPIILAMTIMFKNAKDYGLENIQQEDPLEYDSIELTAAANLALISDLTGTPVSTIKELNPALLRGIAPEHYQLHLPRGMVATVSAALETVPAEKRASWRVHRVELGDTMAGIANRYNSSATALAMANGGMKDVPESGDYLLIPATYYEPNPTAKRGYPASRRPATAATAKRTSPATATSSTAQRAAAPQTRKPATKSKQVATSTGKKKSG
jgi:membrane-bound lytic murein transglycosylase D